MMKSLSGVGFVGFCIVRFFEVNYGSLVDIWGWVQFYFF